MNNQNTIIKLATETIINKMGIDGFVEVNEEIEPVCFTIKTNEANLLIGESGQNLAALNAILKKIIGKKTTEDNQEFKPFILDVNGYQEKKIDNLINFAKLNAEQVRNLKEEVVLSPMSSYERRAIHIALSDFEDIKTESVGDGEERRIVIKPI